jgi:hypothetical protein
MCLFKRINIYSLPSQEKQTEPRSPVDYAVKNPELRFKIGLAVVGVLLAVLGGVSNS